MHYRRLCKVVALISFLLTLSVSLASCSQSSSPEHTQQNGAADPRPYTAAEASLNSGVPLPAWASEAELEGYQFALDHPEMLQYIPCYCGCGLTGTHKSNLDCYIRGVDNNNVVIFDNHAVSCDICLEITLDAKRLDAEGKTLKEIRAYIDERYSEMGPGTDTPMPSA